MNDFLTNIATLLSGALSIDGDFMSYDGASREFYTFTYTIFDSAYSTQVGQLIVETNSQNKVTLQNNVELIKVAIDDYSYSTENSSCDFHYVSDDDISRLESFDYARQIIFEFNLNL